MKLIHVAAAALFTFVTAPASAGQTCVYLVGEVNGHVVTTAGLLVTIPASGMDVDPVVVHVDETQQTILGYSFYTPAVDESYDPPALYVPGVDEEIEGVVDVLAELNTTALFCLEGSRTTPAIPIYVPATELQKPGAFTNIPAIHFNLAGREWDLPGKLLKTEGGSIIIPAFTAVIPPRHVEVPDQTIGIELKSGLEIVEHLAAEF